MPLHFIAHVYTVVYTLYINTNVKIGCKKCVTRRGACKLLKIINKMVVKEDKELIHAAALLYDIIIEDRILAVLDVSAVERQERGMLPVLQLGSVSCANITCYNCYKTYNLCGKYSCKIIVNNRNKIAYRCCFQIYVDILVKKIR